MGLLLFNNITGYRVLFESLKKNKIGDIEYRLFKNFNKNRMLILAEHAFTERLAAPEYGKCVYIGVIVFFLPEIY